MLNNVIDGLTYVDDSGVNHRVVGIAKNGIKHSVTYIVYQNLEATSKLPVFTPLVLTKEQFMKSFNEVLDNDKY